MSSFSTDSFQFIDFKDMDSSMSMQIWTCRNLPEIRKWMTNSSPITFSSHKAFVASLKYDNNSLYFSVLSGGVFVGSINLHLNANGIAERGIYIHPKFWGNKLAIRICKEFYKYSRDNLGIESIITKVLKGNISSNSLEQSLGAKMTQEDNYYFYYRCNLRDL